MFNRNVSSKIWLKKQNIYTYVPFKWPIIMILPLSSLTTQCHSKPTSKSGPSITDPFEKTNSLDCVWPEPPIIQKVFNLSKASFAHKALEKGDHVGKFLLKI